jgi:hypothetical protein
MNGFDAKKLEQKIKEYEDLKKLEQSFEMLIDKLRTEQLVIKQILERASTWKSGNGKERFDDKLEDYFLNYGRKISYMEDINIEIINAKKNTRTQIDLAMQMTKGPK